MLGRIDERSGMSLRVPPPTNRLDTGRPFVFMAGVGASQRPNIVCLVEKGVQSLVLAFALVVLSPVACSMCSLQGSSMWKFAFLKALGVPGYPHADGTFKKTGHNAQLPYEVTPRRWQEWLASSFRIPGQPSGDALSSKD